MKPRNDVQRISSFKTVKRPVVKKRQENTSIFSFLNGNKSPKQNGLTLNVLESLTPFKDGVDMVTSVSRDLLLNCITMEPDVHRVFFQEAVKDTRLKPEDLRGFPLGKLAVAVVAETMSKCNDPYKFCCTIEKNNLEEKLKEIYSSVHWKKLGFSLYTKLYPTVVRNEKYNVSLQDFIDDDGPEWAERIIERMTEPSWTMGWVQKIIRGHVTEEDFNMAMNTLFVKLHLLDPQSVIPTYHLLNNIRALPECNLELATRNYLGGPLDCTPLVEQVRRAVMRESRANSVSRLSLDEIDMFYGIEAEEFLLSDIRELGVWNGRRPDNKRCSKIQDRCLVM